MVPLTFFYSEAWWMQLHMQNVSLCLDSGPPPTLGSISERNPSTVSENEASQLVRQATVDNNRRRSMSQKSITSILNISGRWTSARARLHSYCWGRQGSAMAHFSTLISLLSWDILNIISMILGQKNVSIPLSIKESSCPLTYFVLWFAKKNCCITLLQLRKLV